MIALGLAAILLSLLFSFFAGSVRMNQRIDAARSHLYQRQHLQMRLTSLVTSIVPRSALPFSTGSSFYTSDGLIAIFDNGIDPDPAFSGPIIGKVFIDSDSNLTLAMWPLEKMEKNFYRKEILLSNVQKIRFQFLAKKNSQQIDPKAIAINSNLEWRTDWPKKRWDIPSIIRLIVQQNNREIAFAFTAPILEPIVTYHERGFL